MYKLFAKPLLSRKLLNGCFNVCFQMFEDYLTFCGIGLANAQLFEMSVQEYRRNQVRLI